MKRRLCIGATTLSLPLYYLLKNRNAIYKGSKLLREFYFKELLVRSILGFALGVGLSLYLYGPEENKSRTYSS